ncbi:hypothetical protein QUF90_06135 [Desulfococcaceae bacterium HSG9]|nr:hypothetical protein [Desulfococcaceae bacterium HSG9]
MKLHFEKICRFFLLLFCVFIPINAGLTPADSSDKIRTVVTKSIAELPSDFLDATEWPRIPCIPQAGQNKSRLVYTGIEAMPTAFDDWRASPTMRLGSLAKDSNPNRIGKLKIEGLFDDPKKSSKHLKKK